MLPSDILESGSDDFESGEDIHDAVGSILAEVAGDEGEDNIIDICNQLMSALKGYVQTNNLICIKADIKHNFISSNGIKFILYTGSLILAMVLIIICLRILFLGM